MQIAVTARWIPKGGNAWSEYEDAFYPDDLRLQTWQDEFHCAVADGATETSFSGIWAQMLTGAFGRGLFPCDDFGQWQEPLLRLRQDWWLGISQRSLPWYAEEKLRAGAFSTLMGLTLRSCEPRWQAAAIGDSTLFQVREGNLIRAFPLTRSEEFSSRPYLISSKFESNGDLRDYLLFDSGQWQQGDTFYLMTDALACWALREHERGRAPWADLLEVVTDEAVHFEQWIGELRATLRLRNDDVTLLRVDLA